MRLKFYVKQESFSAAHPIDADDVVAVARAIQELASEHFGAVGVTVSSPQNSEAILFQFELPEEDG